MKRINKKDFKQEFLNNFSNYKEWQPMKEVKNAIFFVDEEYNKQITIEFISSRKYLYTIYINADEKETNDFIVDYFKNIKLDKNYCIHNVLDNEDIIM